MNCQELTAALESERGNQSATARRLGVSRSAVRHWMSRCSGEGVLGPVTEHRLTVQNRQLRREVAALKAQAHRNELLAQFLDAAKERQRTPPPPWLVEQPTAAATTAVVLLSDVHYSEVVSPEEIEGANEYSPAIAEQRLENVTRNVISLTRDYVANVDVEGLVVCMLGDMLSGEIHDELVETNATAAFQATLDLADTLERMLVSWQSAFGRVHVVGVPGNHTRRTKVPRAKRRAVNTLDWLLYQLLAQRTAKENPVTGRGVTWQISEGADTRFTVYDTQFTATHGDQFRGGTGISGALAPLALGEHRKRARNSALGVGFDYMVLGHWHQLMFLPSMVVNGSVVGYNEYAYLKNFKPEPPQQALFFVDPQHGMTLRAPVRCE